MIDNEHHAMDLMRRPDARLVQTNRMQTIAWYIVPGGRVDPKIAEKIKSHPQVKGEEDSLWPGLSQTWRMR